MIVFGFKSQGEITWEPRHSLEGPRKPREWIHDGLIRRVVRGVQGYNS